MRDEAHLASSWKYRIERQQNLAHIGDIFFQTIIYNNSCASRPHKLAKRLLPEHGGERALLNKHNGVYSSPVSKHFRF